MCPECKQPLVAYELGGVEVDRCLRCEGTWLDAGELELIGELAGVASGDWSAALNASRAGARGVRRCPRCRGRMSRAVVGSAPAIEIDRCPHGHGYWLDRGELKGLLDSGGAGSGESAAVAAFFAELYRGEFQSLAEGEEH